MSIGEHFSKSNTWFFRYLRFRWDRKRNPPRFGGSVSLVRNQWYAVLETHRVKQKPVSLRRVGTDLVLWRTAEGQVVCMPDRCPHRGSKLSLGRVERDCIECPYHGFLFDQSGTCTSIPANGPTKPIPRGMTIDSWPAREKHGLIWVWWGTPREQYPEIPWFEQPADDERNSAERTGIWDFHYARVIENSLDAHHFPFIHGSLSPSIGAIIDPFHAEESPDGLISVTAGLKQKLEDADDQAVVFTMAFRPPNVLHVNLSSKIHLIQIATPIDDESSWMYVRYYQRLFTVPGLAKLFSWLLLAGDWKIAQDMQDIPIFVTQQPKIPTSETVYKLIRADLGISLFLKQRKRLMEEAERERPAARAAEAVESDSVVA
jgi:phenylpropionate dioxygenase-like ring-hydroxylating dioxygenase large terminal subunit